MAKRLAILGSTGSIGVQALDVVARHPGRFEVVGLAAGKNAARLAEQVALHRPRFVAMSDPEAARELRRRLDALVVRTVPGVRKAVKWNSPFYGVEGQGWFLSLHCFNRYVKVAFFRGTSLRPLPPGESKQPEVRYLDIHEHDAFDEAQMASWVRQAAALPGWGGASARKG